MSNPRAVVNGKKAPDTVLLNAIYDTADTKVRDAVAGMGEALAGDPEGAILQHMIQDVEKIQRAARNFESGPFPTTRAELVARLHEIAKAPHDDWGIYDCVRQEGVDLGFRGKATTVISAVLSDIATSIETGKSLTGRSVV
jgi:hypothetical protein